MDGVQFDISLADEDGFEANFVGTFDMVAGLAQVERLLNTGLNVLLKPRGQQAQENDLG